MRLVCKKEKLASASFAKLQFWIEGKWHHYMNQNCPKGCMLLDLGGFAGLTISMRKHKVTRARKDRVVVENTRLDQNEKEVDTLNFSKGQY